MTTALLPARHGSFVIYRPLRFHVIEILACFSLPTDRQDPFSIPFFDCIVRSNIYIPSYQRQQAFLPSVFTGVDFHSTRSPHVVAIFRLIWSDIVIVSFIDDESKIEFFAPILSNGWIVEERVYIYIYTETIYNKRTNAGSLLRTEEKTRGRLKRRRNSNMNPSTRRDLLRIQVQFALIRMNY